MRPKDARDFLNPEFDPEGTEFDKPKFEKRKKLPPKEKVKEDKPWRHKTKRVIE